MRTRQHRVDLRLSNEEYEKLQQLSQATGYSVSGILRAMLDGYQLKKRPTDELIEFNRQLLLIGTNLNQIAAKANSLGLLDAPYYRQQAEKLNKLRLQLYERFLMPERKE